MLVYVCIGMVIAATLSHLSFPLSSFWNCEIMAKAGATTFHNTLYHLLVCTPRHRRSFFLFLR